MFVRTTSQFFNIFAKLSSREKFAEGPFAEILANFLKSDHFANLNNIYIIAENSSGKGFLKVILCFREKSPHENFERRWFTNILENISHKFREFLNWQNLIAAKINPIKSITFKNSVSWKLFPNLNISIRQDNLNNRNSICLRYCLWAEMSSNSRLTEIAFVCVYMISNEFKFEHMRTLDDI